MAHQLPSIVNMSCTRPDGTRIEITMRLVRPKHVAEPLYRVEARIGDERIRFKPMDMATAQGLSDGLCRG